MFLSKTLYPLLSTGSVFLSKTLYPLLSTGSWERSGSVVECLTLETKGARARTSPASLCCGP